MQGDLGGRAGDEERRGQRSRKLVADRPQRLVGRDHVVGPAARLDDADAGPPDQDPGSRRQRARLDDATASFHPADVGQFRPQAEPAAANRQIEVPDGRRLDRDERGAIARGGRRHVLDDRIPAPVMEPRSAHVVPSFLAARALRPSPADDRCCAHESRCSR
jgi:hypothetical protein